MTQAEVVAIENMSVGCAGDNVRRDQVLKVEVIGTVFNGVCCEVLSRLLESVACYVSQNRARLITMMLKK